MKKKILISVGGTGGHVFPAIALAQQLQQRHPNYEVLFVGGKLSANKFFQHYSHFNCRDVTCGSIKKKNPWYLAKSACNIIAGLWQSRRIIKEFRPDIVVGFGSFYTFPTLLAALLSRQHVVLHEANSIPGKVNTLLSRYAITTGIHFPTTARKLKGKTDEVGMPLREGFSLSPEKKKQAFEYFHLDPHKTTLLIFGGSQGARALNTLIGETFKCTQTIPPLQILHFTGHADQTQQLKQIYDSLNIKSCVKDFETRMDLAWNIAEALISRAGASTIAEQMEFEVPGILVPYPYATDRHQDINAEFMVRTVGGARCYAEATLHPELLSKGLTELFANDKALLKEKKNKIAQYKKEKREHDFCSLVHELLVK